MLNCFKGIKCKNFTRANQTPICKCRPYNTSLPGIGIKFAFQISIFIGCGFLDKGVKMVAPFCASFFPIILVVELKCQAMYYSIKEKYYGLVRPHWLSLTAEHLQYVGNPCFMLSCVRSHVLFSLH